MLNNLQFFWLIRIFFGNWYLLYFLKIIFFSYFVEIIINKKIYSIENIYKMNN